VATEEVRSAEVAGRRVRWRILGDGPPLVLVHGLAGSWRWWGGVVPALSQGHAVHLVDLPRFGPLWPGRLRVADAADWLLGWLDAAGLREATVVGHSLGGLLTARAASRRPDLVARLVLVAPAGIPSGRAALGYGLPILEALRTATPAFRRVLLADAVRAGPAALLAGGLHATRADVRAELAGLGTPTLIVWGGRDPVLPARLAARWQECLPHAEVTLLPDAGHVPMVDAPDGVADALLAFLRE
jgi:pimeloyl-ACP methyl ester carboxylesterase